MKIVVFLLFTLAMTNCFAFDYSDDGPYSTANSQRSTDPSADEFSAKEKVEEAVEDLFGGNNNVLLIST